MITPQYYLSDYILSKYNKKAKHIYIKNLINSVDNSISYLGNVFSRLNFIKYLKERGNYGLYETKEIFNFLMEIGCFEYYDIENNIVKVTPIYYEINNTEDLCEILLQDKIIESVLTRKKLMII